MGSNSEKGFVKCKKCQTMVSLLELKDNMYICPECGGYFMMPSDERIKLIADEGSYVSMFNNIQFENVIDFPGYDKAHDEQIEKNDIDEAVETGTATIDGVPVMLAVMDARFMMASMGRIVGEKITRAMEYAAHNELPFVCFTASGGARMQEGIVALMQMVKTTGGVSMLNEAKVPYIVVLTDPTSGGVTASFAMLGDIIYAEPDALICFAGPRVVKETIKSELPEGFQKAESVLEHGFIDSIVKRGDLKETIVQTLMFCDTVRRKKLGK